jgi:hypothetical protein
MYKTSKVFDGKKAKKIIENYVNDLKLQLKEKDREIIRISILYKQLEHAHKILSKMNLKSHKLNQEKDKKIEKSKKDLIEYYKITEKQFEDKDKWLADDIEVIKKKNGEILKLKKDIEKLKQQDSIQFGDYKKFKKWIYKHGVPCNWAIYAEELSEYIAKKYFIPKKKIEDIDTAKKVLYKFREAQANSVGNGCHCNKCIKCMQIALKSLLESNPEKKSRYKIIDSHSGIIDLGETNNEVK